MKRASKNSTRILTSNSTLANSQASGRS